MAGGGKGERRGQRNLGKAEEETGKNRERLHGARSPRYEEKTACCRA
jgi:hypothetical protein